MRYKRKENGKIKFQSGARKSVEIFTVCGFRQRQMAQNERQTGTVYFFIHRMQANYFRRPISICEIDKEEKDSSGISCDRKNTGTEEFSELKARR